MANLKRYTLVREQARNKPAEMLPGRQISEPMPLIQPPPSVQKRLPPLSKPSAPPPPVRQEDQMSREGAAERPRWKLEQARRAWWRWKARQTPQARQHVVQWIVLSFFLLWVLFPLYWLLVTSFKRNSEILSPSPSLFPLRPTLEAYGYFLSNFTAFFFNSLLVTLVSTLLALFAGTAAAYSLSRYRFPKVVSGLVWLLVLLVRMTIPAVFIIPLYQILQALSLYNTLLGLIIAYTLAELPLVTWLMASFFAEIPLTIDEMAMVDGCTPLSTLLSIVLPLVLPGLAASAIMSMLFTWNDLLFGLILTANEQAMTLPVGIVGFITQYATLWSQLAASGVVAMIPMVILVLFIQRSLVRGLTAGAIK